MKVVDLGRGLPGALASRLLAHLGAHIARAESPEGDPFDTIYPAHARWRRLSTAERFQASALDARLQQADVCIVGGEDHPDLAAPLDSHELCARFPNLVVLQISGYATADGADRPANDLLVQARTGVVNEEYPDRPIAYAFPMPSYGAALLGVLGILAALLERRRTGRGQVVRTSMQQGTALWCSGIWSQAERPDNAFRMTTPKGAKQPIFRCADGKYVMLMFGTPGSLAAVYRALGIDIAVDPNDRNLPDIRRGIDNYFCDRGLLAPAFAKVQRAEILPKLWEGGIAADAVGDPAEVWNDEQVRANGLIIRDEDGWRSVGSAVRLHDSPAEAGERHSAAPKQGAGPLSGIRVLDFGSWVAGPYGAKVLADLGADVIKVEQPSGDAFRFMYRNFASASRGKRSLAVDMKAPEGAAIVRKLCATADAMTHNMRPGVAERLGIDPRSLRKINPRLTTVHCSAYGSSGPKALNSGWDPVLQAVCGHSVRAGGKGNDPLVYSIPILDYGAGILGAIGLLAGLLRGAEQQVVTHVETNLLDVGCYLLSEAMEDPNGRVHGAPVLESDQRGSHPAEHLYRTRDSWIAVAARTDAMAGRFASALGLELGPQRQWDDLQRRAISERIAEFDSATLQALLDDNEVWCERCTPEAWTALAGNASARLAGFVATTIDPKYGRLTGVGQLVAFSAHATGEMPLPAIPAIGGQTRDILRELGQSESEIADLLKRGVVSGA